MSNIIRVACTLEKQDLFAIVEETFNSSERRSSDGNIFQLRCHLLFSEEQLFNSIVDRDFGLFCPKSELSLPKLKRMWQEQRGQQEEAIANIMRLIQAVR
ncbi:MAG TPA: hypothetical protein VKM54_22180 [Myxococcota bacterium]|nr:hypothetical protein [Myxococcota bacterium]